MRVLVHPADSASQRGRGGCGFYRIREPTRALVKQGYDVRSEYGKNFVAWYQPELFGAKLIRMAKPVKADVVVLQRPLMRVQYDMIKAMQADGVAVVVEIDDDFHAIHPKNHAYHKTNPLHDRETNRDWLMKSTRVADLVTVATPALANRYGGHGRVMLLPNFVPERYLSLPKPKHERLLLGWSGTVSTHPTDLLETGGAIADVLAKTGVGFHVVGDATKVADQLGLAEEPSTSGLLSLEDWAAGLSHLDVGLVPLARTEFNESKSWLKGLEYASVGVPFVATPTDQYATLAAAGVGWTANTREEWVDRTSQLVTNEVLRRRLANEWKERVEAAFTIEANAYRWWDAWVQARANADARLAA